MKLFGRKDEKPEKNDTLKKLENDLKKNFARVAIHPLSESGRLCTQVYLTSRDGMQPSYEQLCASYDQKNGWALTHYTKLAGQSSCNIKVLVNDDPLNFFAVIEKLSEFEASQKTLGRIANPDELTQLALKAAYFRDFAKKEGIVFDDMGAPHPITENGTVYSHGNFNLTELEQAAEITKKRKLVFEPVPVHVLPQPGTDTCDADISILLTALEEVSSTFNVMSRFVREASEKKWARNSYTPYDQINRLEVHTKWMTEKIVPQLKTIEKISGSEISNEIHKAADIVLFYTNLTAARDCGNSATSQEKLNSARQILVQSSFLGQPFADKIQVSSEFMKRSNEDTHKEISAIAEWAKKLHETAKASLTSGKKADSLARVSPAQPTLA